MYSQCPQCQTVYRLQESQLDTASGQVRCGNCGAVFDARARVLARLPSPAPSRPTEQAGSQAPPPSQPSVPVKPRPWLATLGWGLASLTLLLGLALQAGYLMRAQLAASEDFGPMLEALCENLHCTLPLPHEPDLIELEDYSVQALPERPAAWRLSGTLVNTAEFDQRLPTLRISLPGEEGTPLAARDFTPDEYLAHEDDPDDRLYAEDSVDFRLDIANPGRHQASLRIDIL